MRLTINLVLKIKNTSDFASKVKDMCVSKSSEYVLYNFAFLFVSTYKIKIDRLGKTPYIIGGQDADTAEYPFQVIFNNFILWKLCKPFKFQLECNMMQFSFSGIYGGFRFIFLWSNYHQ